jgi:hypothetical protein
MTTWFGNFRILLKYNAHGEKQGFIIQVKLFPHIDLIYQPRG